MSPSGRSSITARHWQVMLCAPGFFSASYARWRQPAVTTASIEEPWRARAGVALAAAAAAPAPLGEPGCHLLAAMGELGGPHHLPTHIVDHRQARGLAARVELDP
jgi:hypothetical protein